jgi:hypothetical protein
MEKIERAFWSGVTERVIEYKARTGKRSDTAWNDERNVLKAKGKSANRPRASVATVWGLWKRVRPTDRIMAKINVSRMPRST